MARTATDGFVMVTYKTSPEFHEWLHALAGRLGLPVTSTLDTALRQLAERSGVAPPPSRTPPRRRNAAG